LFEKKIVRGVSPEKKKIVQPENFPLPYHFSNGPSLNSASSGKLLFTSGNNQFSFESLKWIRKSAQNGK